MAIQTQPPAATRAPNRPRLPLTPVIRIGGLRLHAFHACGVTGLFAAAAVALGLTAAQGRSPAAEALVIAIACGVFFALALATLAVSGRERLIYYHHEIAVLAVTAAVVALLGQPVRGHLDATALGLGAFLACGRVGCLMVGCCHGRVAEHGVRYGREHADAGFPSYLVGVRLVPVQAFESLATAALVAVGCVLVLTGAPAGTGFAVYVGGYAVVRFGLEELRGDADRGYARGLSTAQWTSLALAALVALAGITGILAGDLAHALPFAALILAAAVVSVRRGRDPLTARHMCEIAEGIRSGAVVDTSLGVRLSCGRTDGVEHYSFSRRPEPLRDRELAALAALVVRLRRPGADALVVPGVAGVAHVLLPRDGPERSTPA
jgi:hypothetical protein